MDRIKELFKKALERKVIIATAESCTGGMVAASITDIAGSSQIFDRGFITYSNQSKIQMLSVPEQLIIENGAVSKEVVEAMAYGAVKNSNAELTVAITGIAGPSGGSDEKPVGTVWFATCYNQEIISSSQLFKGDRAQIREAAKNYAIELLLGRL